MVQVRVFTKGSNRNARLFGNNGGEAQCGSFSMDATTHTIASSGGGTEVRVKNSALMYVIKFLIMTNRKISIYRTYRTCEY